MADLPTIIDGAHPALAGCTLLSEYADLQLYGRFVPSELAKYCFVVHYALNA
jgi:hypothetical protein